MPDETSFINIGELSKPATVLIEKISDAVGGYLAPWQKRRIAQAEADAAKIKAVAQIEITELHQRAIRRWIQEEAKKQDNMESITRKALPQLEESANPQDVDDGWIANFFDKCRLVSDDEMQELWAKVLAGEANAPGKYSKRTVNFLDSLDKSDAVLFTALCGFSWFLEFTGDVVPLVYDITAAMYTEQNITFNTLKHLDEIGLISFIDGEYRQFGIGTETRVMYYGTLLNIILLEERRNALGFPEKRGNFLEVGSVLLSKVGQELAPICGSKPVPGFFEYVLQKWSEVGLAISSPLPNRSNEDMEG